MIKNNRANRNPIWPFLFGHIGRRFALNRYMPVEPQAPYISSKDAAKKYGLSSDHIGLLCRRSKIAGLLWGRVWYVSEPSLEDYLKKNGELKEARKQALSRQWRTAWTAVVVGLLMCGGGTLKASADYVTPPPKLEPAPAPAVVMLASAAQAVGEFEKNIPAPSIQPLQPIAQASDVQAGDEAFRNIGTGLYVVGEAVAAAFAPS